MSFFCNFCNFIPENQSTVALIKEETQEKLKKVSKSKLTKCNTLHNYSKLSNQQKSFNKYSPEKDKNGNSIFNIKFPYICLFCGGESCKYENPSRDIESDLDGLIANLYFDCIYASQRPCTKLIKKYNLIELFKQKNIKLIVNCQINGEHPYCGPNNGLEKDFGFSYSPSVFISEGIEVFCRGFQDLTPPHTFSFMIDIVKRMAYIIKYKKARVLVHCHAGNGRTGIVNVCFFIYYFNLNYNDALKEVRKLRKKGVEKPQQELYCQKFEEFIKDTKNVFPNKRKTIGEFVQNQKIMDFNFDNGEKIVPSIVISYYFKYCKKNIRSNKNIYKNIIDFNFIPKIIFECIEKIVQHKIFNKIKIEELYDILNGLEDINESEFTIGQIKEQLKQYNWEYFEKMKDINIINEILFTWLNDNVIYCISPKKIENIINEIINMFLLGKDREKYKNDVTDNNLENKLQKLFERYISNIKFQDEIQKIIIFIKINLTKIEYQLIKYFSIFLQIIYPTNNIIYDSKKDNKEDNFPMNLINEYKRFIYKLSLFLLGYNLDKINSNQDSNSSLIELLHAKMLIFIFELFIFYHKEQNIQNLSNEEDIYFIYKNRVDFKSINNFL